MNIAIIGAGISGSNGKELSKNNIKIDIFEKKVEEEVEELEQKELII